MGIVDLLDLLNENQAVLYQILKVNATFMFTLETQGVISSDMVQLILVSLIKNTLLNKIGY